MTTKTSQHDDSEVVLVAPLARLVRTVRAEHDGVATTMRLVLIGVTSVVVATAAALAAAIAPLLLIGATAEELRAHVASLTPRPRVSVLIACVTLAVPVVLAFAVGWTTANRVRARADADHDDAQSTP